MAEEVSSIEYAEDCELVSYNEFESSIGSVSSEANFIESDLASFGEDCYECSPSKTFQIFSPHESDIEETVSKSNSDLRSRTKPLHSPTEASKIDESSSEKGSFEEVVEEAEQDENKDKSLDTNNSIFAASKKFPKSSLQVLGVDDPSTVSKSPQSFTEAMNALNISDAPDSSEKTHLGSGNKNTPKHSRLMAKTTSIFDSPYNTRLKARLLREREQQSPSEGRSTEE